MHLQRCVARRTLKRLSAKSAFILMYGHQFIKITNERNSHTKNAHTLTAMMAVVRVYIDK